MKDIEELKLNIYNSLEKYKIHESEFNKSTINIESNDKEESNLNLDFEIPDHSWKDFNSNTSKSILEWHDKRFDAFFDETDDSEEYFTLLWSHPKELLNLCILHESYEDFLKLTDEIVNARSTDLPKTLKFDLDSSFDEEQLFLYNSIAHYIIAIIQETEPLFERMKKDYPKFNQDHALDNLKKVLENILCCMLDNAEVYKHDFYDTILGYYENLNAYKYDTVNILKKFIYSNKKFCKPKDFESINDGDIYRDFFNDSDLKFLNSFDWNKQRKYIRYITNAIRWKTSGNVGYQNNEIYFSLIEKISEDDYNKIKIKIEFYLTLTKFYIVEGEYSTANLEFYKDVIPLYNKMIDPEDGETTGVYINGKHEWMDSFKCARRQILIKILEFNLDTFTDCLKGTYYFGEKPPDYFYNILDILSSLRYDEEFSVFSNKFIKALSLNYELMVEYNLSNRHLKKIIELSNHNDDFALNLFAMYYLKKYKGNITFLDYNESNDAISELTNINDDTYSKLKNHLKSKNEFFNISFLIQFYIIVIKHYHKEDKTESLKEATNDLLKFSEKLNLNQFNIFEISLLLMDLNSIYDAIGFIKKITNNELKDKAIDLMCSKFSTIELIHLIYSIDNTITKKIIERLIVSNRVFSENEFFMLCNHSSAHIKELNFMLNSNTFRVN
tara:strand:- start:207 stop:2216 length:2010 start_codon:yes stop_codon:yes gene_type:complete